MEIFATSKNSGHSWNADPVSMLYMGTSLDEAVAKVGTFVKYEVDSNNIHWPTKYLEIYSAIPRDMEREIVKFYSADGWWYSVVKVEFSDMPARNQNRTVTVYKAPSRWIDLTQAVRNTLGLGLKEAAEHTVVYVNKHPTNRPVPYDIVCETHEQAMDLLAAIVDWTDANARLN